MEPVEGRQGVATVLATASSIYESLEFTAESHDAGTAITYSRRLSAMNAHFGLMTGESSSSGFRSKLAALQLLQGGHSFGIAEKGTQFD